MPESDKCFLFLPYHACHEISSQNYNANQFHGIIDKWFMFSSALRNKTKSNTIFQSRMWYFPNTWSEHVAESIRNILKCRSLNRTGIPITKIRWLWACLIFLWKYWYLKRWTLYWNGAMVFTFVSNSEHWALINCTILCGSQLLIVRS